MPQPPITIKASLFEEAQAAANAVHHKRMAELENMRSLLAMLDESRPALVAAGFELGADELHLNSSGKALFWHESLSIRGRTDQFLKLLTSDIGFEVADSHRYRPCTQLRLQKGALSIWIVCYDSESEGLQA